MCPRDQPRLGELGGGRHLDLSKYFPNSTCPRKEVGGFRKLGLQPMIFKQARNPNHLTKSSGGNMSSWVGSKGWNSSLANNPVQIFIEGRSRWSCQASSAGNSIVLALLVLLVQVK
jgi:hypothetical protein